MSHLRAHRVTPQLTPVACVALMVFTLCVPVKAQTVEEMRVEMKAMREEINALKRAAAQQSAPPISIGAVGTPAVPTPSPQGDWNARLTAVETQAKTMVVAGAAPGSMRLPGTNTSITLYGIAEVHLIHDLKLSSPSDNFTDLSYQPLDSSGGTSDKTKLTAQTSRIGVSTATPIGDGVLNTKLEVDNYAYGQSNRNRARLRLAYGEYKGWLIGQTWSTFMDLDDLPETVDFNGPIGAPFSRRAMVRYSFGDAKANVKMTFAAEDPEDQTASGSTGERLPQLIARVDRKFDSGAINLRFLLHEKRSLTETKRGFGVGIGGNLKLGEKDTLMAQYTRVDGDIDQLYGSNGYAIKPVTNAITFDINEGLVLGYAHLISDRLRGNVALGYNRGDSVQALDNRTLTQLFLNMIYAPMPHVELGAEYIYGIRKTFAGEIGTMSRVDLMGRYTF